MWLSMLSQFDNMLSHFNFEYWVILTLNIESFWLLINVDSIWLKYSPVTHFAESNFSPANDSTFYVKMTWFFSLCVS